MLEKISEKINAYLQAVIDKDVITREDFDLLVAYRNAEESREMMRASMAALKDNLGRQADVIHAPMAVYDEREVN